MIRDGGRIKQRKRRVEGKQGGSERRKTMKKTKRERQKQERITRKET